MRTFAYSLRMRATQPALSRFMISSCFASLIIRSFSMRLPTLTANKVIRTEKMFVKRTTIVKAAQMNNGTLEYALSGEEFIAKKAAKAKNMTIQLYLPPVLTLTWVGFSISLFENKEDSGFRRNDRWGSCNSPWVHACGADGSQRSTHPTGYGSKFDLFAPLAFCWWEEFVG
jgi:hypothetical protein